MQNIQIYIKCVFTLINPKPQKKARLFFQDKKMLTNTNTYFFEGNKVQNIFSVIYHNYTKFMLHG